MLRVARRYHLMVASAPLGSHAVRYEDFMRSPWLVSVDSVRCATLQLLARELRSVPGSMAELGVFQGDFSILMQRALPGRRLHLFDTFTGFDPRDVDAEQVAELGSAADWDFRSTSAAAVVARLPDPGSADLHIGWFPETATELADDERFCLVSLDADLMEPMLAGLNVFYPRLSPGGYILVHDYNNPLFPGAAAAVRAFLHATPGAAVFPLPDEGGTLAVSRPPGSHPG